MPTLNCEISRSLLQALETHRRETGETVDHVVMRALADILQVDHSTLFQISTSGALVEGVTVCRQKFMKIGRMMKGR